MSEQRRGIVVNGHEYPSVDEMPPDIRELYERTHEPAEGSAPPAAPPLPPPSDHAYVNVNNISSKAGAAVPGPVDQATPSPKVAGPKFGTGDLRVRVRISPLRLVLWALAILLILYFYLRRR